MTVKHELTRIENLALAYLESARNADEQRHADQYMSFAVREADRAGLSLEAIEAKAAAIEAAKAPKKARCPHYDTIKAFAAAAREMGLSMADKDRARGAMGVYLGKRIASRSELTANDWENALTGVKAGVLFW